MDTSNWINLGILLVTAAVGVISWRSAKKSAEQANVAASRSAIAAEEATRLQAQLLEIEKQRHIEAGMESRRAKLHAQVTRKVINRGRTPIQELFLAVFNTGQAAGSVKELLINEQPIQQFREFARTLPETLIIGPEGHVDLRFFLFRGGQLQSSSFHVKINWEDDLGVNGEWSGTVSG